MVVAVWQHLLLYLNMRLMKWCYQLSYVLATEHIDARFALTSIGSSCCLALLAVEVVSYSWCLPEEPITLSEAKSYLQAPQRCNNAQHHLSS